MKPWGADEASKGKLSIRSAWKVMTPIQVTLQGIYETLPIIDVISKRV